MRPMGSIRPTATPDVWRIVASMTDEDGKRRRIWQTVHGNQSSAQDALVNLLSDISNGRIEPEKKKKPEAPVLTGDWLATWLQSSRSDLRPSTFRSYSQHVRDHIDPVIGNIPLADLRPIHVRNVNTRVIESGCSSSTAARVFATLRRALTIAEQLEMVERNVARNVEPPKQRNRRHRIELDTISEILDRADREPLTGNFYRVAFATGLRRGELMGMRWTSTDLDRGTITVAHTLTREPGRGLVTGQPKSDNSHRTIHLDADTIEMLREQQVRQLQWHAANPDYWSASGYVWTDELGKPLSPERLTKGFKRAAVATGHPELHLHHLRHAHALALVELKTHPRTVQQRLGHASAHFTMQVYVSDSESLDAEAAVQFGSRFGRKLGRNAGKDTGHGASNQAETAIESA